MQIIREAKRRNSIRVIAESSDQNHVGICNGSNGTIRLSVEGKSHYYLIKLNDEEVKRICEKRG